ncbi:MAG: NAD(P)-dependent oxidoreductase [Patescibacteria group bacterium]
MKIVILNNCWLEEKHLNQLKKDAEVIVYNSTTPEQIIERLDSAEIAVLDGFHCRLTNQILNQLPKLRLIALNSTGYDMLDVAHAAELGIKVCNIPNYASISVAEHTFALILSLTRRIPFSNIQSHNHGLMLEKTTSPEFKGVDLAGKSIGLVGVGQIGSKVAQIALGFGMDVFYYDLVESSQANLERISDLDYLLTRCDFVSLHLPLNKDTKYILGSHELNLMKKGSYLINTSRGQLIKGEALIQALQTDRLAGVALDVLDPECQNLDELLQLSNVIITPHSAWFTQEALQRLADSLTQNILNFIYNKPTNLVN